MRVWRTTLPIRFIYLRRPSWGILARSRQFGEQRREEGRGEGSFKGKPAAEGGSTAGQVTQCTYKYGFGKVALQDVGL
jgi:hypothetical protein